MPHNMQEQLMHALIAPAKWWLLIQESFCATWAEVYQCRP